MSDQALLNAENRKKQLQNRRLSLNAEILQLDREIGEIDTFIKTWHLFADAVSTPTKDVEAETKTEQSSTHKNQNRKNSTKEEVAAAAREAIRRAQRPMTRQELYDTLVGDGLIIEGKEPLAVLTTMLWRMKDEIRKLPEGRYDIAGGDESASLHDDFPDLLG
ncbi:uncharacterized protein with von Willebrand factor type A (vWA) domain [Neorhizobium galegae]|uniref:hypothetical protein n=1 Tax=Neorhizobium galegae TaxID=399 RepID=UPI001AE8DD0A|nr:hypothetical protein [Neorhizobium galegae]MBP2548333.1 uncharacterized protein with von Willebrand factor type A (vWA) domain [Neorhizobium galegae]